MTLQCGEALLWPAHPDGTTVDFVPAKTGLLASDTYVDNCGNYYRAYWTASVAGDGESKGRSRQEKVGKQFKGQFETGPTVPVPLSEFLFLTELKPGDAEKILVLRNEAFRSGFRLSRNAFVR